ncbi:carbohydrate porin [Vibrio breoganii]|uniref:Carbohydrate porin n=1 Tax=Vibrio breoganii TaxID=553239 RepID=A0AAP8MXG8_9VIBR|nr:carbohydrate porin [Vibrio breoganii]NMO73268.1 carbohydrate porin [Vibrio breoganii]NMR69657.1 carbohydrate porin [Vibrio breoganii]PMH19344.1 lactam utilization protein LamB [Vibrio breoganii]PMI17952.1 lactam utilization protein LamB [Vibrio breoganii]PML14491.1 lactam utilization protein LamB [Vibrio breoganii]
MKLFKLLPLSLAVAGTLASVGAFAAEYTQQELIDGLEARLAEVEARVGGETKNTQGSAIENLQSEIPLGIVFTGYARYGTAYDADDAKYVGTDGQLNGNASGRLGNEGNGGEFQFGKYFEGDNGTVWDVNLMLEHWGDDVGLKKFYAGATNVFESQKDLYIWAGRDFHQRPQTDLNDYFWMMHDGQGAGFYNLDLNAFKFDLSVVGQAGSGPGDNGRYAVTSKFHGFSTGNVDVAILANYGFKSDSAEDNGTGTTADTAYQIGTQIKMYNQSLVLRYSDNAKDSVFDLAEDRTAMLAQFDGSYSFTEKAGIQYSLAYQTIAGEDEDDRSNSNIIVRPTYQWNDIHSTWLEAGYSVVDYDDFDATNSSWKATLSQNIAIGGMTWSRPMLRFYATVGNSDNEYSGRDENGDLNTPRDEDTLTVGAMFEAWW